jgi:hypothetical protein
MKNIFCINDNGRLLNEIFDTVEEAKKEYESYIEDDQYLMSIHEMTELEFYGRISIGNIFSSSDANKVDTAIQVSEQPELSYLQIAMASDNWIGRLYADHFKFALIEGGYRTEDDFEFEFVELISFKEFLNKLRKRISQEEKNIAESWEEHLIFNYES